MRALQIVFGIVLLLLALFAGGCAIAALVFILQSLADGFDSWADVGLYGLISLAVGGLLAQWGLRMLRGRGGEPPEDGAA